MRPGRGGRRRRSGRRRAGARVCAAGKGGRPAASSWFLNPAFWQKVGTTCRTLLLQKDDREVTPCIYARGRI